MSVKQVSVNVSAELYDAGQAVANFINLLRKQVAAGWNPAADIPSDIAAGIAALAPVAAGISDAAADYAANPGAAANAVALGLTGSLFPSA